MSRLSSSSSSSSSSSLGSAHFSIPGKTFGRTNQSLGMINPMPPPGVLRAPSLPHALPSRGSSLLPPVGTVIPSAPSSSNSPPDANENEEQDLQREVRDLRTRILAKDQQIQVLENAAETSDDLLNEWQAKYDRLWDAHRKLQKTNHSLEDKLLRIVDKFEADKNQLTRDLASQTQKLVQAKLMIQQLHDQNGELQSDLQLSITLLQNRPSTYLTQRVDSLPPDMQSRVRSYLADKQMERMKMGGVGCAGDGKKIKIPIMEEVEGHVGENEKVSAAILAKVLEERAKERKKENKFCIDVGTQTHGWQFPDKIYPGSSLSHPDNNSMENPKLNKKKSSNNKKDILPEDARSDTAKVIQILRSISLDSSAGDDETGSNPVVDKPSAGDILFASVIKSRPSSVTENYKSRVDQEIKNTDLNQRDQTNISSSSMKRSATFSAIQTDI